MPVQTSTPLGPSIGSSPLDPAFFFSYPLIFLLHRFGTAALRNGAVTQRLDSKVETGPKRVNYFPHKK